MYQFSIDVSYYDETGVFVGTSDNIPGLTLETGTIAELLEVAMDIVPDLLSSNLNIPTGSRVEVDVVLPPQQQPSELNRLHPTYHLTESGSIREGLA